MREEEIIEKCELIAYVGTSCYTVDEDKKAIQGLVDLYNKEKLNSLNLSEQLNKEKEKNKALKEGLKYRVNYCKLLEKELYANGVNYKFEKTEIEKQFLEE